MKILGIILEINPFHKGHKYFIEQAIFETKPDLVIGITSTSFTMRGDVSYLSKFDKTKILLDNKVDLVLELPVIKTLNSADFFAYHSVEILSKFGITHLAFGIENGKSEYLHKIVELTETKEFNQKLSLSTSKMVSYKMAYLDAFSQITDDQELITYLNKPNFTLAIQYIKAIKKINPSIKINPISRIDNFYEDNNTEFISAYNLRELIKKEKDFSEHLPYSTKMINHIDEDTLFNLIKYQIQINQNIPNNHLITEGIDNYIINNFKGNNLTECLDNLCNKRYTKSRIKRILISSLLDINESFDQNEPYYRVLGFSTKGRNYLNTLPKSFKKLIKTTLKNDSSPISQIELKASKLYDLLTKNEQLIDEYKIPIKKEE